MAYKEKKKTTIHQGSPKESSSAPVIEDRRGKGEQRTAPAIFKAGQEKEPEA